MKKIKIFNILLLLASISLLLGCGSGGGSSVNPINPNPDIPSEYESAPAFNKTANEIYTHQSNSENVAIDLPIGSTYFISITNTSGALQTISLISSVSASLRPSTSEEPVQSEMVNFADSFLHQERAEAEMQYRLNFINQLKLRKNSKTVCASRASLSGVAHNEERVGGSYDIITSDGLGNPVTLKNCKFVAETKNAKFFVDQEYRSHYSPQRELMERIVTEGDFALTKVFDSDTVNIYNFIYENFGDFIDIDGDQKLSIIITPYLSSMNSSYLGLFMCDCMVPWFQDPRDQILIAPPLSDALAKGENYVRYETITNLCHEYQHVVNFSERFYRNNFDFSDNDNDKYKQELGFDEGCSVCAEALFRRARGEKGFPSLFNHKTGGTASREYTGNDKRFNEFLSNCNGNIGNVFPFYTANTRFNYYDYGRNGLFMLYLHDRFSDKFKNLIQHGFEGESLEKVIPQVLGTSESLNELQRDWYFALQHEFLKTEQIKNSEDITTDARFKYNDWLRLNSYNKTLNNSILLNSKSTAMFKLTPKQATSVNSFRFFINSSTYGTNKNLEINIIKL